MRGEHKKMRLSLLLRQPHFDLEKISFYCTLSLGDGRLFLSDGIPKRKTEQSDQDDSHHNGADHGDFRTAKIYFVNTLELNLVLTCGHFQASQDIIYPHRRYFLSVDIHAPRFVEYFGEDGQTRLRAVALVEQMTRIDVVSQTDRSRAVRRML